MSTHLETLVAEVMRLSAPDSARPLDLLIASLDAESPDEWDDLADQREKEIDSSAVPPVSPEAAMTMLNSRYPE
jgi:hypothetical protein